MHTTAELLDLAKARHSVSDWKLSSLLDVVPSAVKNYRAGRSFPDDAVAQRLADLACLDAGYVVACIHAQRAGSDQAKALWIGIADRLQKAGAAAAVLVAILGVSGSPDADAHAPHPDPSTAALCLMSTQLLRRLRALIARVCASPIGVSFPAALA